VFSAVLGGVVVAAAYVGKFFKFHQHWLQYRALVEALEREKEVYSVGAGEYAEAVGMGVIDFQWNASKISSPTRLRNS
jgi:hypothetical protein